MAEAEHELPAALPEFDKPLPVPPLPPRPQTNQAQRPVPATSPGGRLGAADAFLIVTPAYKRSFPAPLKNTADRCRDERQAKPAGSVSYGGRACGRSSPNCTPSPS